MHRRFFLIAGGTLALLVIIILGRTFTYGGPPADVQAVTLVTPPGIDVARAAERLVQAIRFRTVTVAPGDPRIGQEGPWLEQQAWLAATYPTFHTVAEKGYLTLKITATAEGGHSSTPPRNSATVRLAKALIALDENQMPSHLSEPPVSELFAASVPDLGFATKLAFANQWLLGGIVEGQLSGNTSANAMIRTTTAPTMLTGSAKENVLAQRAVALVNFRVHPRDSARAVIDHVEQVVAGIEGIAVERFEDSGISGGDASPVSPTDNLAYGVRNAVASEIGGGAAVVPALVIAATDSRYASLITPNVYRFAPIIVSTQELAGIHGTDEKISVENVGRLVRGYAQIILAMDAGS